MAKIAIAIANGEKKRATVLPLLQPQPQPHPYLHMCSCLLQRRKVFYEENDDEVVPHIITVVECCMVLRHRSNFRKYSDVHFSFFLPFSPLSLSQNPRSSPAGGQSGETGLMRDWLCSGFQRLTKANGKREEGRPPCIGPRVALNRSS